MSNVILKRLLCGLLVIALAFLLLVGCGSRKQDPLRAPLSTGAAFTPASMPAGAWSPAAADDADTPADEVRHVIVYVTETGGKYHCSGCSYLAQSCIPIALKTARQRYGPCSKCCPPT